MKKVIGLLGFFLSALLILNTEGASAYLFHSSQLCQSGKRQGSVLCYSAPSSAQCLSIGGNGTVLTDDMGCVGGCNDDELSLASVGYCDQSAPQSCPANCNAPGSTVPPNCVASSGYAYNSSGNSCQIITGTTPSGTLTSSTNGICTGTPGGTCTVSVTYSINSGVTNGSLWQCDRNGSNCSNIVSSIAYNSIIPSYNQNITVSSYNSASQGSYVKLVNGPGSSATLLADMYAAAIPQQSYSCPNGTNYNRYTSGGTQTSNDPGVNFQSTDFACGTYSSFARTCPNGTSGSAGVVDLTPSRFSCFAYDYGTCSCNPSTTCSAGTGEGGTTPSGTYPSCACPGGQVYNSGSNSCACPAGQSWDSGTASCRQTCPSGSTGTWSPSCSCPSPASYSSGSNTCTCPAPRAWNGSSCSCPSGQVWDGSTCQTPCPSGTTGTYHPSCTCPAPRTYNTGTMTCQCPAGQTWNGSTCVMAATRCDDPLYNMYIEYSSITTSGFNVAWDCGTLKGTGGTYIWGPDQSGWTSAVESGNYTSSGKSAGTTYNTALWCGHPYGQSMYCDVTTAAGTPYTVTTNAASSITSSGASLSFAVSGYTGTSVSSAGSIHLYQADGTTHINNYTTSPATVNANGTYTASLSSLTCNTTYQFRGEAGSTYGSKLSFTTSACPGMTVAVTNSPATTTYGQNVSLNYTVSNIPSGQTATCGLYDWTGNSAISGVSTQSIPATSGSNTFTFNPSPSTLPVNPAGYGYVVKCTIPTPATTAQANATVYVAVDPTPTLSLGVTNATPGQMTYQCNNSTGVYLRTTGGSVQNLTAGQYVYTNATTPQTLVDLYSAKFKYDTQTQSAQPLAQNNFFYDRTNNGAINSTDVTYVSVRPLNVTVTKALFASPTGPQGYGLAIGQDGYLYVSNTNGDSILKIDQNTGAITTFHSSSGTPTGMAFDSAGNLFVSHYGLSRIVKITPGGVMTTFVPSISRPTGMAFDNAGNLFIARQTDGIVAKVTPAGVVSTFASGLGNVNGIAINPNNNYVYVASQDTGNIYQITPAGSVTTYASGYNQPIGLTMDRTTSLYVSSLANGDITKIAPGGAASTVVSGLTNPNGMAINSQGRMYIGLYAGQVYRTTVLDTFPQNISGSFPVVQGATYALDCFGSFGTLPATTTYAAVDLSVKYADSAEMYPTVGSVCPSNSTTYSISRTPTWSTPPAWSSGYIWSSQLDTDTPLSSATTTYNYTLNCYRNNGMVYTGQVTNSINVPPKISVSGLNAPIVATNTVAVVTWKSDGDSCDLKNYNGSVTWAGAITGTPITGGYQYTYTMSPSNPNFTWLNSSRMGTNAIGWMTTCKDTTNAARQTASATSKVQVYIPTDATITPPDTNGNLKFTCTPDFDYMDIQRNSSSLSGYPKTWNTNQTSNYSVTLPNLGGTYQLVCKSSDAAGNIDIDIYPNTGLQVYGAIGGSQSTIPTTAVVTGTTAQTGVITTDGTFNNLSYSIRNATTWSVAYYKTSAGSTPDYSCNQAGTGCVAGYSAYRLLTGNSTVDLNSSFGLPDTPFNSGAKWVITASDGSTTKTLTLLLNSNLNPTGSMIVTPNPAGGVDSYNLTLRCENSIAYNLYNTSYSTSTAPGLIVSPYNSPVGGSLSTTVTYTAVNSSPSANTAPILFECIGTGGTLPYVQSANLPILSKTPATVNKFTVYPSTVLCGGGQVALAWQINNPRGKNCVLDATTTKPISSYASNLQSGVSAGIQNIRTKLNSGAITVRNGTSVEAGLSTTTAFTRVDANNNNIGEIPRIQLRDPTKFILSCFNQGVTTTISVEARTACQGEQ